MRVKSVQRIEGKVRCFDLTVAEHHTVALDNGVAVSNCDERCAGNACGVCNRDDLRLRQSYLRDAGADRLVDVSRLRTVDQTSVACRVRARLVRPERYRFADNGFRRHLLRRAGYRAQERMDVVGCVSKNAIWFASDAHGYRDWTCGTDYVEYGLTRSNLGHTALAPEFLGIMREELAPWLEMGEAQVFPARVSMKSGTGPALHELELDGDPDTVLSWIANWNDSSYVPMRLRAEGSYFATGIEEVNARDFVDGLWLVHDGTRLLLRMLSRRRAGPYQVWQALSGKPSWIEAARYPARTLEVFSSSDSGVTCEECGQPVPESLLGDLWDADCCPECKDLFTGSRIA